MNIKAALPPITPLDQVIRPDTTDKVKTQHSTDRDADGRKSRDQQEQKESLTEQEWQEALDKLKQIPGIKAHNLSVQTEVVNDKRIVKILSPTGEVVRRLTEGELWNATLHLDLERPTGQIFDKAM